MQFSHFLFQLIVTNELLLIFATSFVLTVLFEMPFTNMKKLLFTSAPKGRVAGVESVQRVVADDKEKIG
jgi:hypothetical protein